MLFFKKIPLSFQIIIPRFWIHIDMRHGVDLQCFFKIIWANRFELKLNQIWVILLSVATKPWIIYDQSLHIFPLYAQVVSILKYIHSICHTIAMVISNSIDSFVVAIVVDYVFIHFFVFFLYLSLSLFHLPPARYC